MVDGSVLVKYISLCLYIYKYKTIQNVAEREPSYMLHLTQYNLRGSEQ